MSDPFYIRVQKTIDLPGLRLRSAASTDSATVAFEAPGAILTIIEAAATAALKIGLQDEWLRVRDANALEGFVAAWYVEVVPPSELTQIKSAAAPTVPAPDPQKLAEAINAERVTHQLPALQVNPILMSNAQKHAEYMASGAGITHESADGSRPFQRHVAAGYPLAGDLTLGGFASENIMCGTAMTIDEAIAGWYGDDPHTHTMIGDMYNECGAGVAVGENNMIYYCFDSARSSVLASQPPPPPPPPADVYVVYVAKDITGLRIRKKGDANAGLVRVANAGEWLIVDEPAAKAKAKIGADGQWLKVKDKSGNGGFVAAWMVSE